MNFCILNWKKFNCGFFISRRLNERHFIYRQTWLFIIQLSQLIHIANLILFYINVIINCIYQPHFYINYRLYKHFILALVGIHVSPKHTISTMSCGNFPFNLLAFFTFSGVFFFFLAKFVVNSQAPEFHWVLHPCCDLSLRVCSTNGS